MTTDVKKTRGRPRVFNMDEALDKALEIFWKRGYEGTSIGELSEKLGVNKPSLYAAFGNKEELFKKVLSKYTAGPVSFIRDVVNEPTAFKVAESFLYKSAEFLTDSQNPKGCMIVQAALSSAESSDQIKDLLIGFRAEYERSLAVRFEKAKKEGDLSTEMDPEYLAKYLATLHQGMSVQATSGATKEELLKISKLALQQFHNIQK